MNNCGRVTKSRCSQSLEFLLATTTEKSHLEELPLHHNPWPTHYTVCFWINRHDCLTVPLKCLNSITNLWVCVGLWPTPGPVFCVQCDPITRMRLEQNGHHFADDIFNCSLLRQSSCVLILILPNFLPSNCVQLISIGLGDGLVPSRWL